jgi:hypothetical protein
MGHRGGENPGHSMPGSRRREQGAHRCAPSPGLSQQASKRSGNRAFHALGFFFVHAAKVRPVAKSSPSHSVMSFCAGHYLAQEIKTLKPPVVCFLGATNATPAAVALFGERVHTATNASLGSSWHGTVILAPQPVRAGKAGAPAVLRQALTAAGYKVTVICPGSK